MNKNFVSRVTRELADIKYTGQYKNERIIESPQGIHISVNGIQVLNFCSNNYLGLSCDQEVIDAAYNSLETRGYGLSSVRFICGTQDIHKKLELKLSEFLGTEDSILYAAAFDANGGLFEPLFGEGDDIISDELNHASLIDGMRLCKAKKLRYKHNDMVDLERILMETDDSRSRIIVTDGTFSMDGTISQLNKICDLADRYDAIVVVDDSHSTGIIGRTGRGTHEYHHVMGRVDIITGTLGKALGGANGGFTSGKKEVIDMLRQRSRPYLFSNSLAPSIVGATIRILEMLEGNTNFRERLEHNTKYFRSNLTEAGFDIKPGKHPIVPIMLHDAEIAKDFADKLLIEGIYVTAFFYPVVPKGQARIRVQLNAAHTKEDLDKAIASFINVGVSLNIINKTSRVLIKRDLRK
jgi:glycine C-acetyltransferase